MDGTRIQLIHADHALLPDGWARDVVVGIDVDGRIASVKTNIVGPPAAISVPVLLPALSNLHSHTFQRGMAGLAEARGPSGKDSFWTWREIMYRFLDLLSPEDVEAIAAFAFTEMLESGFSGVAEFHYLHHRRGGAPYADIEELSRRIVAAAALSGIGLTLLPVHYAQGGVDGRQLKGGQLRFGNELDGFERLLDRASEAVRTSAADASLGLAVHSLRAVPPRDLAALARQYPDLPFHMHLAEQEAEVDETLAEYGTRPVEWLLDNHNVDARWCLVHCTQTTAEETLRLAASGAIAGLCPVTEANLGDGIFDGARFMAKGGSFGVGTDSNVRIGAAEELCQLEYSQRLRDRARVVIADKGGSSGRRLYDAALAGGTRALGRDSGRIEAGSWADLVAIDLEEAGFGVLEGDRLLDAYIFGGGTRMVSEVWSAGRHVVSGGRHRTRHAISERYRKCLAALMEKL